MGDIAFRLRCLYRDSATGSGDLYLKAADEIERFQKERDDINEKYVRAAQRHVEEVERLRAKVEELEKDIAFYRDGVSEDATDPGELRERIEELEREQERCNRKLPDEPAEIVEELWDIFYSFLKEKGLHFVFTEQIDAAVERISHWTDSTTDAGWALLAMLFGIKQCPNKSCVDGREPVECADGEVDLDRCPYCNGHGWSKEVP